jgi:hypothetical protein
MAEYLRDKMSDGMPDSMSGHMPRWGSDEVKKTIAFSSVTLFTYAG